MKPLKPVLAILLAISMTSAFADATTGSRSKMDNSASGARGGDAATTAGTSPSTSNAPASTGQTGDGTPTTAYGNTDPKAIEGTTSNGNTSIGTGVGATPNGTSPKKGTTRSNAESSVTGDKEK